MRTPQMPTHHPSEEMLMDYAAGSLAEAPALLVATHLALCPECRARVSTLEALGGVLLEELTPVPLDQDCLDAVLARLDEPELGEPPGRPVPYHAPPRHEPARRAADDRAPGLPGTAAGARPRLPEPLRSYAGGDAEAIAWRRVISGIESCDLPIAGPDLRARLYRIAPGVVIPRHTHGKSEALLVLEGAFSDQSGRYARGDVAISDHTVDHAPRVEREQPCICLAVIEGALRLTGPIGRWMNRFVRI
jgi:putative transcriptional regulator